MTASLIGSNSTGTEKAQSMIDVPSTNQVVAAGINLIFKITPSPYLESNHAALGNAVSADALLAIPALDAYLVGKFQVMIPILARADFSTIKTPAFTGSCSYYLVDNLDDKYVMMFISGRSPAPLQPGHLER
jgi:hypothetical protein